MTDQDDKLDKSLTTHQRADGEALAPQHLGAASREGGTDELGEESDRHDAENVAPGDARVQETDVGVESGERKVQRQEQCANQIFNLLSYLNGKPSFVRTDQASHESPENGVHTDDAGEEGGAESDEERKADNTLTGAILEGTGPAQIPDEGGTDEVDEEEHVACACQEDPECSQSGAGIDEGNAEGEEDPACTMLDMEYRICLRIGSTYQQRRFRHQPKGQ